MVSKKITGLVASGNTHPKKNMNNIYQTNESDISFIKFENMTVHVVSLFGEPWFVAKDVCTALDITDHRVPMRRLNSCEKGGCSIPTLGGNQTMIIVSESGFYKLIARSRKASISDTVVVNKNWPRL